MLCEDDFMEDGTEVVGDKVVLPLGGRSCDETRTMK